ncbi:hypothetical protein ACTMTI_49030 [Nonomuraea sp. H19]|uniref:hypothetical protein n=1 Tax=Nonomuraea sp. H19 TaxID=3452206 RepID=UPI003F89A9D2
MGFDGCVVPEALRPYVDWVTGMAWPEGDAQGCFRMADACVVAAHRVVADTPAADAVTAELLGDQWDGAAQEAFVRHVKQKVGGRQADLVKRLIDAAIALNGVGVAIQYAQRMITLVVVFLLAVLPVVIWQAPWLLRPLLQVTRMTALQIAKHTMILIAVFAAFGAALDYGTQYSQVKGGRRDGIDWGQLATMARDGAINGLLTGLLGGFLGRLATPALRAGVSRAEAALAEKVLAYLTGTLPGQALQYGVAGAATTAISLAWDGHPLDWDLILKSGVAAGLGADGQHLIAPHLRPGDAATPPADPRTIVSDPASGHARDAAPGDAAPGAERLTSLSGGVGRSAYSGADGPGTVRTHAVPDVDSTGHATDRSERGATAGTASRAEEQGRPAPTGTPRAGAPRTAGPGEPAVPHRAPTGPDKTDGVAPPPPHRDAPGSETTLGQAGRPHDYGWRPDRSADQAAVASPSPAHDGQTPTGDPPPPGAPTRAERVPDDGPPPADASQVPGSPVRHRADTPPPPADLADASHNMARVPFAFEGFFTDPRWAADVERFEQRLGAYYFNDPQTLEAARTAVRRLRDVLTALTLRAPDESPADFARRVETAFFRDDAPTSAGQVGTHVTLDELLARGNLRELMTAFYNAAYFNDGHPRTLTKAILDVFDMDQWARARAAGMDLDMLERARRQLDGVQRVVLGKLDEWLTGTSRFSRDVLQTGNVIMMSERGMRELADVIQSQVRRQDRSPEEQQRLGLITTPDYYEGMGAPLGRFERAFVESLADGPLRPGDPLPWREGLTSHENTSGRWARQTAGVGHSVIDGISVTTTRMMVAAEFLGMDEVVRERFLGALVGWMLPSRDHSLFEIMRGAQLADLEHLAAWPSARVSAVDLYRSLPGMDLHTLRAEILPDGLFPHEAGYLCHATDPGGFAETQFAVVRDIAERLGEQLGSGRVTDPELADWLRRNGADPLDPASVRAMGERLSPGHMMALTVYTRPSHDLINNVTRTRLWTAGMSEAAVRKVMDLKVERRLAGYLEELAEGGGKGRALSFLLRPLLHEGDGPLTPRSPLNPTARKWVDAAHAVDEAKREREEHRAAGRRAEARQAENRIREARREQRAAWREIRERLGDVMPRLAGEMRWHADMAHDALLQLPPVGSPDRPVFAFRGDWLTPVHSPIYGSRLYPHGTTREFLSLSRSLEVAVKYVSKNLVGDRGVLVVWLLTGGNGRDISIFSTHPEQQEILLPPHSHGRQVRNPELEAQIRDLLNRTAEDLVRRGELDKVPDRYDILIMEEE